MKRIFLGILLMLMAFLCQAQNPVVNNQPAQYNKWIRLMDSLIANGTTQINGPIYINNLGYKSNVIGHLSIDAQGQLYQDTIHYAVKQYVDSSNNNLKAHADSLLIKNNNWSGANAYQRALSIFDNEQEVALSTTSPSGTAFAGYGYEYHGGNSIDDFEHDIHVRPSYYLRLYSSPDGLDTTEAVNVGYLKSQLSKYAPLANTVTAVTGGYGLTPQGVQQGSVSLAIDTANGIESKADALNKFNFSKTALSGKVDSARLYGSVLSNYTLDAKSVHNSGKETIAGQKTFSDYMYVSGLQSNGGITVNGPITSNAYINFYAGGTYGTSVNQNGFSYEDDSNNIYTCYSGTYITMRAQSGGGSMSISAPINIPTGNMIQNYWPSKSGTLLVDADLNTLSSGLAQKADSAKLYSSVLPNYQTLANMESTLDASANKYPSGSAVTAAIAANNAAYPVNSGGETLQSVATRGNNFAGQLQTQASVINGTGGSGFLDMANQSVSPAYAAGHLRIYSDSLGRFSWKNGSNYRRTIRMPYPTDVTATMPYKANPVLEDSTHAASTYMPLNYLSATGPLSYNNGALSIQQAGTSQAGYLSSNDWNAFSGAVTYGVTTNTAQTITGQKTFSNTQAFLGLLQMGDTQTSYNTTLLNPVIGGTAIASPATVPFNLNGNLILQSRPTAGYAIYLATGATPAARLIVSDGGITVPGSIVNSSLTTAGVVHNSATGLLSTSLIQSADFASSLSLAGTTSAVHLKGSSSAPTIAAGAGAGTSPTVSVVGSDMGGTITITTGTSPTSASALATVTFNTAYGTAPYITLTRASATAPTDYYLSSATTGAFTLTGTLAASTTYKFNYTVVQ